ncbi:MAG TPA: ATP-binding protein [Chthoniobacterales bacterium]|jgi:PAS domain S-box-containing protein
MKAPLPANERERLRALQRYAILDTPPEAAFDRITRMVASLLKVPISAVTLVDEHRQWFKSHYGMEARETSRDLAFCAHAILSDEIMVVANATEDDRFHDNPSVTGDPNIRFYAGAPLQSAGGFTLGTLCAVDTVPREFSAEERQLLNDLAKIVTNELELRLILRERSQQAAAIHHLKSGVVVGDPNLPDCPLVYGNPAFWKITGYLPEEMIGMNCRLLQGAKTDPNTVAEIREAMAARRTFYGEILNYRKDGTPFWHELTINPVFDDAGNLISFVGLQTDVTERKATEALLQESFEKLKKLEAQRDDLTGMIIHDLRSPLTTLIGSIEFLHMMAASKLTEQEQKCLDYARSAAASLSEMVTSLLDISRLEAGEMPLNLKQIDLRDVLTAALDPFLTIIGTRSLKRELPTTPVDVRGDADLLQRVVTNLVSNAVKFTPDGGKICVSVIPGENGRAKVSVADTGIGIPVEYHGRIFEKFGQVEGKKDRNSTGMGLAFCKLAVEAQGGTIGVESTMGVGTTIWFVI